MRSEPTVTARSHGSQCDQSSNGTPSCLSEQQAAKARAVDEQVAAHAAVIFEADGGDEAALAVLLDADDLALDALGAVRLGIAAEELAVGAGVEVKGVGESATAGPPDRLTDG